MRSRSDGECGSHAPAAARVQLFILLLIAGSAHAARADDCQNGTFSSTFELIQKAIFEDHSCSSSVCHGAAKSGGLDLRAGAAYANLVDVAAQTVPGFQRVVAGEKDESLLWLNLAAKTFPDQWHAPLRAMPLDPTPALTPNELEAIRRWIEVGAPETGIVKDTDTLLDACLPPPEPIAIKPLPPPASGEGVQIHMPRWILPAHSENEVCFASYYDVTDQVPPEFRGPDGTSFRFNRSETRQDPLSHHLIVNRYEGNTPPDSTVWGEYRCRGGARDGQSCSPFDIGFCGADSGCATDPERRFACIGVGPGDATIGLGSAGIVSTQETASENHFSDGVYAELPLQGLILWDSHAFNLTGEAGKLEAWVNFYFAPPQEQKTPVRIIFNTDKIFATSAPAFGTDEVCNIHVVEPNTHLYELTSHTHRWGKWFRTFLGAWRCTGGPNVGTACSPSGGVPASADRCDGAPCTSTLRQRVGDCNRDDAVTIDELVAGVNLALGVAPINGCEEADVNGDLSVSVDEIITAVNAALGGVPEPIARDPDESLLFLNLTYNDPVVQRFDPPMIFPPGSSVDERALTYCAFFDNGFTNSDEVKRKSTSPQSPIPGLGGPCQTPTHCTRGKVRAPCRGLTQAARDASCDSGPGAGDGQCDACPLRGGATSEDEMFILIGQYFSP